MFTIKIFVTLLLIQSLRLTYAQDDEDFGLSSLSRFEPRRQSVLYSANQNDFDVDDDDASSRGPVNPLPIQSGRNDDNNEDDYDDNQGGNSQPQAPAPTPVAVSPTLAPASVKGQALPSSSGRLSFPRFVAQPASSFVAPLPVAPAPRPTAVPVSVSTPLAPATVLVGKTNLGKASSDPSLFPRLVRPVEQPKTVRIVKARVVRPQPIVADQSASLPSGVKTAQVTRVVRPVLVQSQPQPTFNSQSVPQPISSFSFATPITSGSNGPNSIVTGGDGGVKTIPFVPNSQAQDLRFRTVTTRRPTTIVTPVQPLDVDEDGSDFSTGSRPAPVQISGVKTIPTANPVSRFPALRPVAQPIRQPTRLEVIYADENLNLRQQNEDDEDANAARLSQPNIFKYTRPIVPGPLRAVPQPYLIPAGLQAPRSIPPRNNGIFFQPIQTADQPQALVSSGKINTLQSTFNARPQPVPTTSASQFTSPQSGSFLQRPLVRTPVPTSQPLIQIQEEPIPTFQQVDLIRNRPLARPSIQEGQRPSPVAQPTSRPTIQPIVQIRDGAGSPELPLPSPPRPVQIVRVTPSPAARPISQVRESVLPNVQQPIQISQPAPLPQVIQISDPARPLTQVRDINLFAPLNPDLRPAIPTVQTTQEQDLAAQQPARPANKQTVQVNQVQLRESAFPITQSNNLGGSRFTQPQQPVQTFISAPQDPQSFEILRLREPSQFTVATRQQPQPLVVSRPRPVPASLPSQPVARPSFQPIVQTNLPVAQPNSVRVSQPLAPVVQQPQRRVVSFPSVQQQVQPVQISQPASLPQVIQISAPARVPNVQFPQTLTQSSQPSFITPLPAPNRNQAQSFVQQPVLVQQQRPTISFSQVQPTPLRVQQQPQQQQRPVVLPSAQNTLNQPAQQQVVQIREQVPDDFSQIEQIRFARA